MISKSIILLVLVMLILYNYIITVVIFINEKRWKFNNIRVTLNIKFSMVWWGHLQSYMATEFNLFCLNHCRQSHKCIIIIIIQPNTALTHTHMPTYLICDIVENHDAIDSSIVGASD